MNRFYGGSNNLYGGELNNEDTIKDATKDIFKKIEPCWIFFKCVCSMCLASFH